MARPTAPSRITNKEFFKKVANQYTELLSTYTAEGMCYRVDLRLRPDGRYGEVCISLDGARELLPAARPRLGTADADQGARVGGRARAGPRAAGVRRAADLFDHARFPRRRSGLGNARAHQRKAGRASAPAQRAGYQAGARRHSRYRISGAVPAAPARRPRALGAPRRHAVRAVPPARQELCSPARNMRGWRRPISSCAIWSTGCNSTRTGRPTRCPPIPKRWRCWRAGCPPAPAAACLRRIRSNASWKRIWKKCRRFTSA